MENESDMYVLVYSAHNISSFWKSEIITSTAVKIVDLVYVVTLTLFMHSLIKDTNIHNKFKFNHNDKHAAICNFDCDTFFMFVSLSMDHMLSVLSETNIMNV